MKTEYAVSPVASSDLAVTREAGKALTSRHDQERIWELFERFEEELTSDLDEARDWIFRNCGSHERMDAIIHLYGQMDFTEWLVLLGDIWSGCDNIGLYKHDLIEALEEWLDDPLTAVPELMNPDEKAAFDSLPDQITIYRGCGTANKHGLSWTLSREVAVQFPFNRRYQADEPTLLTAIVNKSRIAAIKLERNEQEVIVVDLPESSWTEQPILEPPPRRRLAANSSENAIWTTVL